MMMKMLMMMIGNGNSKVKKKMRVDGDVAVDFRVFQWWKEPRT